MEGSIIWILAAFAIYLIFMVVIGVICARKNENAEDYFLGGRKLSGAVAALSAQASDMSGWLLMGLPGSVYALGTGRQYPSRCTRQSSTPVPPRPAEPRRCRCACHTPAPVLQTDCFPRPRMPRRSGTAPRPPSPGILPALSGSGSSGNSPPDGCG